MSTDSANSIDLCHKIKNDKATKGIPVIMLTAKGETEILTKAHRAGANDYRVKPFNLPVMINKITTNLRQKSCA